MTEPQAAVTETAEDAFFSAATERRRSPRHNRQTPAWLSAASGSRSGNGFSVQVKDLSLHGVGFVSEQPLRKNDNHWMVIADRSLRLSTRVRIVNLRQRQDGHWDVGGEFF
ncbi:MAG: PilZ domain-containing protein [Tepidisphaeraceae bacterium]